jgi:L-2,4-diaminobutyric acid acetyltransferase
MWELAADTGVLDVNSRYAYVLLCRDFSATSVIANLDDEFAGFVTGYRRPDEQGVLFVWQVAVAALARGRGLAGAMLENLIERTGAQYLETTISPDNAASIALFTGFAERRKAPVERSELFGRAELGAGHEPEFLYRIGPIPPRG